MEQGKTSLIHFARFVAAVAFATLICAFLLEALFPGMVTIHVSLDFFLWVAILASVIAFIIKRYSRSTV